MLIRAARREDVPLIFDSWMKSWRVNRYAGCIPNNLFYCTTRSNIENLVARGAILKVACLESDEDNILGWVCYERLRDDEFCVHYVYVKDPYLTRGVGQRLAEELPEKGMYSYRCNQVEDFFPGYRWVPEIARRK
jgi:GNAT superfamily N-acetyltransferase